MSEPLPDGRIDRERVKIDPIMRFFSWDHLRDEYRETSARFGVVACAIQDSLRKGPERTVCLRKLLEAKDAAVRAIVDEIDP